MKPAKRSRPPASTAFVPRIVFATAFAGVVPACSGSADSHATVAATGFGVSTQSAGASETADAAAPSLRAENIVLAYAAFDAGAQPSDVDAAMPDDAGAITAPAASDAGRARGRRRH